tara:strand:- start:38887 stop:39789 length:903 start_codon:yes stop_codon:yes gene_type:complete
MLLKESFFATCYLTMTEFSIGLLLLFSLILLYQGYIKPYFHSLSLKLKHRSADLLLGQLSQLNRFSLKEQKEIELIEHKYFTAIGHDLISYYRQFGLDIFQGLNKLRLRLKGDMAMEDKLKKTLGQAYAEIIIIMLFSWLFVFIAGGYVDIALNNIHLSLVLIWQLLGLVLLRVLLQRKKSVYFKELAIYFKCVFSFELLCKAPIGINELARRCEFSDLNHLKQHHDLRDFLLQLFKGLKVYGEVEEAHLGELSQCVVYKYECAVLGFEKYSKNLKLGILMTFFMTSYLLIILSLLSSML